MTGDIIPGHLNLTIAEYALNVGVCLAMKGMFSSKMLCISYLCISIFVSLDTKKTQTPKS